MTTMIRVFILTLTILFSFVAVVVPESDWIEKAFELSGYYFIFLTVMLWVIFFYLSQQKTHLRFLKDHYQGIALAVAVSILIFAVSPPEYKLLADETSLLGTSMSLYKEKKASTPLYGMDQHDSVSYIDKRPLLHPFLVSVVHKIRGYSSMNTFVVSFIISASILFLFYLLISEILAKRYGLISILIVSSLPISFFWFPSGLLDPLNLAFTLLVFLFFFRFIKSKNIHEFNFLLFTLVLLSQCRYEAIFVIFLVMLAVLIIDRSVFIKCSIVTSVIPLLLIPIMWQRMLFSGKPDYVEHYLHKSTINNIYEAFSLENWAANSIDNLFVLSGIDPSFGFSWVITLLTIIGVYLVIRRLIVNRSSVSSEVIWFGFLLLLTLVIYTVIYFTYYWGNFTSAWSNRLALIFLPYIVILALYGISSIEDEFGLQKNIIPILCVFHLMYFLPYGADQKQIKTLIKPIEYNQVLTFLEKKYGHVSRDRILLISENPDYYYVQQYGAVNFATAVQRRMEIKQRLEKYLRHVIILEKYNYLYSSPSMATRLDDGFTFHQVDEIKISLGRTIKVSELESIQ